MLNLTPNTGQYQAQIEYLVLNSWFQDELKDAWNWITD